MKTREEIRLTAIKTEKPDMPTNEDFVPYHEGFVDGALWCYDIIADQIANEANDRMIKNDLEYFRNRKFPEQPSQCPFLGYVHERGDQTR